MIKLINDDCFNVMKNMSDKSIDMVFTSPPYNARLRIKNGTYVKRGFSQKITRKYKSFSDDLSMNEYQSFLDRFFEQCVRISSISFINLQFLTGNKLAIFNLIGKYSNHIKEFMIWDKGHGQPAVNENILNSSFEFFIVLSDIEDSKYRSFQKCNFERGTMSNVLRYRPVPSTCKNHSASMPFTLAEKIIKNFSNLNDLILDPFLGTGTSGLVCKKLNRQFIGIEIDSDYFNFATERINQPIQTDLF